MAEMLANGWKPIAKHGRNLVVLARDNEELPYELTEAEVIQFAKWLRKLNI